MSAVNVIAASPTAAPATQKRAQLIEAEPAIFGMNFGRHPFLLRHNLADHPLFSLPRLVELSKKLPDAHVEYNLGNLPLSMDPENTPRNGLSEEETIRRIEDCRSWMVLKYVEQDPDYRELLDICLNEIKPLCDQYAPGMCKREAFVFISSPGSITPYHMDPEYNFLLQVRGEKTVSMFEADDRTVLSERELEGFYSGSHRNLVYKDEYQNKATLFDLQPGMGLHFPVTAPHWVKNGSEVSVSFSVTFHTRGSERRSIVYEVNAGLRRFGLSPTPFGHSHFKDSAKYFVYRVARRSKRILRGSGAPE